LHKQVYGIDRPKNLFAEYRSQGEFIRVVMEGGLAELGKKSGVQPILAALGQLKDIFGRDLTEIQRLSGTWVAVLLELELGAPKAVHAVFEFLGQAQLAAMRAKRVVTVVAKRLDGEFPRFGIGHSHFEIRSGRNDRSQRQSRSGDSRHNVGATHSRICLMPTRHASISAVAI
jgi:hypothetical protein